ncbi:MULTISPECIES: phospho-N-acetylmuramoyl-pentapeptide-transferase [Bacteroidota]|jgi:phospho-N-acetylmuramoyl-pentapeptide-transferase|uniref:Phospho-N-acetylmuramoyl-pentapeptide-transferase n=3 Tax=Flectobacillus TaxID=101 RepID=A0ABT6Z8M8_9BACT|nr:MULTISPECIES: phospho-N-acetylmuramoyl-pentapeptide-transferase [Bacteroidota]NBA77825.1 phospho-N-acetylmuramoyl-pentapeptide-transferase [Emticicia sp. ODNR4P]MDI9860781.1 phospho-N-acetylmuramoyl-pentapeptide-transferase [Flectobacillus roseus]MDI9867294.1 phospho-N-acetylmuramoyl-pentapeptide-transferase [Flectobacillus longus]MDI9869131.1 phospho-N-acetylmuramoyl-pentapeptide-transferase [Flectobacillus roseus]MDI9877488.1 phospho-N-acetylmuramoyl-pentapeptide-transferase [Flectobacill
MLYYLFDYLDKHFDFPGAGVFQYITFRAIAATITSLGIAAIWGKTVINMLRKLQIGEDIRDLGLEGQMQKKGTPTMGGFIILLSLLVPTLLFAKLHNVYIILLITTAVWLGAVGFLDDYIKVFRKNKEGLSGRFKIVGQVGLGLIVGLTMWFNDDIKVRTYEKATIAANIGEVQKFTDSKDLITTVPFLKNNQFDYSYLLPDSMDQYTWILYVLVVIIIITAISNGANITDGIDGLAAGTSVIIGIGLAILAYVSGNKVISQYLNIMFIPNSGELAVFCAAFVGACVGFLWYNAYPAQVFMGDTGSLMLGGVIATLAIVIRKELLIPVLCGIFVVENLSVIIQVSYFKYTKKKYGEGRRVFLMSPLHHHYQKKGYNESKIVTRFWIVCIILVVVSLVTLKLR